MRIKEAGQAFILVLIILAIGGLMVTPSLRLINTSLKSSQIVNRQVKALYACDGGQEYILWQLLHNNLGANFTADGQAGLFTFNSCGNSVNITVIMRATEGKGGVVLATDDVIHPTKTVECEELGNEIPNDWSGTVTYTINLEQLSSNTTQGLDAVYDILPKAFDAGDYVNGSSYWSENGGQTWEQIGDPDDETFGGQPRFRWPASGNFSSPKRDFTVRQVKQLRFEMNHTFSGADKNKVHCNWVVLKPWNTLSGPQAMINVGTPKKLNICDDDGLIQLSKVSDPEIIQPGVETDIEYTISIFNRDGSTHAVDNITDYLPPGFYYVGPTSNLTTSEPVITAVTINGIERERLVWELPPADKSILDGETKCLTFWARTTKDVSGSYYNEVEIGVAQEDLPAIFSSLGIDYQDLYTNYSWTTGAVIVPAYDSRTGSDTVTIDANLALILGSVSITSWQVH